MSSSESNTLAQNLLALGEERMGEVVGQLLQNEAFVRAIQAAVSSSVAAKRTVDGAMGAMLGAANIPTLEDVAQVEEKVGQLEDMMAEIEDRLKRLRVRLGDAPTPSKKKQPKKTKAKKKKATAKKTA